VVADSSLHTKSGAGPSDAALVVAARAGEAWAQEALFTRYARMVLGLSQRILAGRDEADDLLQDAFVHAFTQLHTLQNPQAFAAWLSAIVVRTASKRLRRHRLLVRLGIQGPQAVDAELMIASNAPPDVAAELRRVYQLISRLGAEERVALVLRRVEGMELSEIATAMRLSVATVKRRLGAAEARLNRSLGTQRSSEPQRDSEAQRGTDRG
jgi:RNA polymerase sigma-70 factor, ECF subfamily